MEVLTCPIQIAKCSHSRQACDKRLARLRPASQSQPAGFAQRFFRRSSVGLVFYISASQARRESTQHLCEDWGSTGYEVSGRRRGTARAPHSHFGVENLQFKPASLPSTRCVIETSRLCVSPLVFTRLGSAFPEPSHICVDMSRGYVRWAPNSSCSADESIIDGYQAVADMRHATLCASEWRPLALSKRYAGGIAECLT